MSNLNVLRVGNAGTLNLDSSNRAPIEPSPLDANVYGYGVPTTQSRSSVYVPLAISAGNIVASAIVNGGATLAAGTGVTAVVINGVSYLDITGTDLAERAVSITGTAGGVTAVAFTVVGLDAYLQPVTATFNGPAATATTTSLKTFRYIRSITSAGTTTAAVTIQTADVFGFPARVNNFDQVLIFWNNALITATTGFVAAVATSPSTAALGNVRGTYAVQNASDGTKRLRFIVQLDNPNNMDQAYGVAQV